MPGSHLVWDHPKTGGIETPHTGSVDESVSVK